MLVALDANVWVKERMLRSAMGAALLYAVRRKEGRIVLPCVTREEALYQIVTAGERAVEQIKSGFVTVQAVVGKRPDYRLPDRDELLGAAQARLSEIGEWLMPVEAGPADYRAAMTRVIERRPPSERKEEFRDSLFLELLIPLARRETVHLVTEDGDFFDGSGDRRQTSKKLRAELAETGASLCFHPGVKSLLDALGPEALSVDHEMVWNSLELAVGPRVDEVVRGHGCLLGELASHTVDAFVTERHTVLAISFTLRYVALDIPLRGGGVEPEGRLVIEGSACYDMDSRKVTDVQVSSAAALGASGGAIPYQTHILGVGDITIGTRYLPYSVRHRLGETGERSEERESAEGPY